VLDAIDGNAIPQHIAEYIEFRAAKALARGRGGTDRAMILQQQEAIARWPRLRHIALA
jgi:hypothetical protein